MIQKQKFRVNVNQEQEKNIIKRQITPIFHKINFNHSLVVSKVQK